jgi:hypothetical protein
MNAYERLPFAGIGYISFTDYNVSGGLLQEKLALALS